MMIFSKKNLIPIKVRSSRNISAKKTFVRCEIGEIGKASDIRYKCFLWISLDLIASKDLQLPTLTKPNSVASIFESILPLKWAVFDGNTYYLDSSFNIILRGTCCLMTLYRPISNFRICPIAWVQKVD